MRWLIAFSLIIEQTDGLKIIEIKSGTTINSEFFANLEKFEKIARRPVHKHIVYGSESGGKRRGVNLLPWIDSDKMVL
jgi:hypothetical protein